MISDSHYHTLSRQRIADVGEAAAAAAAAAAEREGHLDFAESSGLRYPNREGARDARDSDYL